MQGFSRQNVKSLSENTFSLLDDSWMLITAGTRESFNTMTASWGGFGILWKKPVAFIFIRPQRYTFQFAESSPWFTLSFFDETHREILNYCGTYSGRDVDKIKNTGLVPLETEEGNIIFDQARLCFECRKLYSGNIEASRFIVPDLIGKIYPTGDFHRFHIGEIVHCMKKA